MRNALLRKLKLPQAFRNLLPKPVSLLSLGQIQVRGHFRKALKFDRIEVLIVAIDELSLIGSVVGHSSALRPAHSLPRAAIGAARPCRGSPTQSNRLPRCRSSAASASALRPTAGVSPAPIRSHVGPRASRPMSLSIFEQLF